MADIPQTPTDRRSATADEPSALTVSSAADPWTRASGADSAPPAAFLLELCGVLYDDSCWRRWMLQLLARMGVRTQYKAFYQTWEQEYFPRVCQGAIGYWEGMREFLHSVGLPSGRVDEACAAGQSRRKQWELSIRPLPGVTDTLRRLVDQQTPVAVIAHASFDYETATQKLQELGLSNFVSNGIHVTSDLGRQGRYHLRFQLAANALGMPASRIAYVGCGRLPIERADADGMQCFGYNTDLTTLPCKVLNAFRELREIAEQHPRRLVG